MSIQTLNKSPQNFAFFRSIEYNYQPTEDKILSTNLGGYNACELSFVTVGSYSQFQNFFKNIAKENYLSNIYEVYIEPKNKTLMVEGKEQTIKYGMTTTNEIKIGKRRIIEFFIYPLIKYLDESIKVQ